MRNSRNDSDLEKNTGNELAIFLLGLICGIYLSIGISYGKDEESFEHTREYEIPGQIHTFGAVLSQADTEYGAFELNGRFAVDPTWSIFGHIIGAKVSSEDRSNELLLGLGAGLSEEVILSTSLIGRREAEDITAGGAGIALDWKISCLWSNCANTDSTDETAHSFFRIELEGIRYTIDDGLTNPFTQRRATLSWFQEFSRSAGLMLSFSGYGYTENPGDLQSSGARKIDLSHAPLLLTGFPRSSALLGFEWWTSDFWLLNPSLASTKIINDSQVNSLGFKLGHLFSESWFGHLELSHSRSDGSKRENLFSLGVQYSWN